jgi:DNA primase
VNSPETPVYTKGKNLYGLSFAKDEIRNGDCAVIVEGYLDCIIPFQHGIKNVVASQGTALTDDQVRLLKRYCREVVVVFDGDAAGELAALRSLDIFIEQELDVRVAALPKGVDPDTFVRRHGPEELKSRIQEAQSLFDYKLAVLSARFDRKDVQGKVKIASGMLETIDKIKNAVMRSEYIKKLSQELDVKEEALLQEAAKIKPVRSGANNAAPDSKILSSISPVEKLLIKLMLEESELIRRIKEQLNPEDFLNEHASRIVSLMFDLADQGKEIGPHILIHHFGQEEVSRLVCESIFLPEILSEEHKDKVVDDCIKRIKEDRSKLRKQLLHNQIKIAQGLGDEEKLNRLIEEFHGLIKKR